MPSHFYLCVSYSMRPARQPRPVVAVSSGEESDTAGAVGACSDSGSVQLSLTFSEVDSESEGGKSEPAPAPPAPTKPPVPTNGS